MTIKRATKRSPKKATAKSVKVIKAEKDEQCIIDIVGNKLWVLAKEPTNKLSNTLDIAEFKKPLPIQWHPDKNSFIKELLNDFNLLKNGTFGDSNGKSLSGWEIDVKEPASAHVDLSEEWYLKDGHTAFLLAPKEAERPRFIAKHKIPAIGDGSVDYRFSGFFATHRAGGRIHIDFYDKADNKLGEEIVTIPFNPKYGGGQSLVSYAPIEFVFTPIKETQYMQFKIELGEQEEFSESHSGLFFTELCLGHNNKTGENRFIPYSESINRLTKDLFADKWSAFGYAKLPILGEVNLISIENFNHTYKISLKNELKVIKIIEKQKKQPEVLSNYQKNYYRNEIQRACTLKDWHKGAELLLKLVTKAPIYIDIEQLYGIIPTKDKSTIKILDTPSIEHLQIFRCLTDIKPLEAFSWQWLSEITYQFKRWDESRQSFTELSKLQALSNKEKCSLASTLENIYQYEDAFYLYLQVWNSNLKNKDLLKKLSDKANKYDISELPYEAIVLLLNILREHDNEDEINDLISVIFYHIGVKQLQLLGKSLEELIPLLPNILYKNEKNNDFFRSIHFLKVLDENDLLKEFPDWLAVEILWLSVQLEKEINSLKLDNELDLVALKKSQENLKTLKSLGFWKEAVAFDLQFPLIDTARLKHGHNWKVKPTTAIRSLSQFLAHPESRTVSPHILFNTAWYKHHNHLKGKNLHPLVHFFRHSNSDKKTPTNPNPYFDSAWYQQQYLAEDKKTHPLLHYMAHFQEKDVQPSELFNNAFTRETQGLLDNEDPLIFYLKQLENKEANFQSFGFSPSPFFDRQFYIKQNYDIKPLIENNHLDPFEHFANYGKKENRKACQWQAYNQFVRHQLFHLEPFNSDSSIDEYRIEYLKMEKSEYTYLDGQKIISKQLVNKPLISILVPVYQVNPKFLREMIESVLDQTYDNWQLCIVDDASVRYRDEIIHILVEYSKNDSRIVYKLREENGHICNTTNNCITLAKGEYLALLDHDDLLTPDALYEVVVAINANSDIDIIYSDEDKVDEWGVFSAPYYKPDWSPHTFWAKMYVCHLTVYKKKVVETVGGFRIGYEGSQDFDLFLRCSEISRHIHHIPKVLYHWRMHVESTASGPESGIKDYCAEAGRKAVKDALIRQGIEAEIALIPNAGTSMWVKPKVIGMPLVDIIIPSRDGVEQLDMCLTSIYNNTTYNNFKVTIINNNSKSDSFFELLNFWKEKEYSRFQVITDNSDFNFSKLNNNAVNKTRGEYLLFLNDDTEVVSKDWLDSLIGYAQLENVGAVGAKLLYPDGTIQHAGVVTGIGSTAGHVMKNFDGDSHGYCSNLKMVTNYSAVTGACLMISREKFKKVGGFEEHLKVAFNDIDFCLKVCQEGFFNVYIPFAVLYHYESKSRGYEDDPVKKVRFEQEMFFLRQKWGQLLDNDPFYSPWLTLEREDMSYKYF